MACYVSTAAPSTLTPAICPGRVSSSRMLDPCWHPGGSGMLAVWHCSSAAVCRQHHQLQRSTTPPPPPPPPHQQHPDPVFNPWQQAAPAKFRNEMQCGLPHKATLRLRLRLTTIQYVRSTQYQRAWPSMLLTHLISFPRANPALGAKKVCGLQQLLTPPPRPRSLSQSSPAQSTLQLDWCTAKPSLDNGQARIRCGHDAFAQHVATGTLHSQTGQASLTPSTGRPVFVFLVPSSTQASRQAGRQGAGSREQARGFTLMYKAHC